MSTSPCAHMKHDKVFIIPERLLEFVPNSPNALPWKQSEAFIGVPLFHEGKSFAHFGIIWSLEGASKRQLSWSFIEVFMHSLEDMILQRILEGRGFAKKPAAPRSVPARIIPLDAITASQSLKPYARSLSHELRTPMQGVVGMLDIMQSTVRDAVETQTSQVAKSVFEELKSNIEIVQGKCEHFYGNTWMEFHLLLHMSGINACRSSCFLQDTTTLVMAALV
jgi:signal transduction histidine kinase